MTSSVKEEDELRDVVIIMSQQLPDTDLFIKLGCLFPFCETVAPPFTLDPSYVRFYHLFLLFVSHAKTSTGSNAHFRQEWTMEKASQWFVFPFRQTGRRGGLFSGCGDKRSLLFLSPLPQRWVCLSAFLLINLDYIMNHSSRPSSTHLCGYATHRVFLS